MKKMTNPLFQKHYSRLVAEGIVKSALGGLTAAFTSIFIMGAVCWLFGFGGVWLPLAVGAALGAIAGLVLYFTKYRPDEREVARRVDRFGLKERTVTMLELSDDDSDIARLQRENTVASLATVENRKLKFRLSRLAVILLICSFVLGTGMTTVVGLASNDVIKSGNEIINPEDPYENHIAVYYYAMEGGELEGEDQQLILPGESTTPVVAVAEEGYMFIGWDDGYEYPERYDINVTEDCGFTAMFTEVDEDDDGGDSDDDGATGDEEGDEANDAPESNQTDNQEGEEKPGDASGGDSQEPTEGEEDGGTGSGDSSGLGAAGKWEDGNQFIDGNTYYRDYLEMYYEMAMQIFAETGEIPPEMREFFENYFGGI